MKTFFRLFINISILILIPLQPLQAEEIDQKELRVLADAIFMEARNQSTLAQYAVGIVILNRVKSKRYPNSVQGVVFQSFKKGIYQFSYLNNPETYSKAHRGVLYKINPRVYLKVKNIAMNLLRASERMYSTWQDYMGITGAMYYFNPKLANPRWRYSKRLKKLNYVGEHLFFSRLS